MITIWNHKICSTITCGAIASNSKAVIAANPLEYFSYDPFGNKQDLTSPRSLSTTMKLSNNERYLALASDIVDLMDLEKGKVVRQFTEHTNSISGICSNNSSPHVWATVGLDKTMRIFDSRIHPGQVLCIRNDVKHRCITYAPNSMMLFCGGDNIFIFDIRMNTEFNQIKTINQVNDIQCHPEDCVVLGCTDDRMIKVWDIDTKECLSQTVPLESQPQRVLFEPMGKVVIASTNQKLYAFDWDPFHMISQIAWSSSKQSTFMIMNGDYSQDLALPSQSLANEDNVDTLDIRVEHDTLIHFGITHEAQNVQNLCVRTIQIERLLEAERKETMTSPSSGVPRIVDRISPIFEPLSTSTPCKTPSPLLRPQKPDVLIRKIPRSSSNSRNSEMKQHIHRSSSSSRNPKGKILGSPSSPRCEFLPPRSDGPLISRKKSHPGKLSNQKGFEEMKLGSTNFITMMKARRMGIQKVKATMKSRHNGEDEVLDEAISLPDKTVFVHLLQQLLSKPINLKLAARILPELRSLLAHKNSDFADVALDVLDTIVTQLLESICQGLAANAQCIGVDIAAEQRHQLCSKCKEHLTEIYITAPVLQGALTEEQNLRLTSVIGKLVEFVS